MNSEIPSNSTVLWQDKHFINYESKKLFYFSKTKQKKNTPTDYLLSWSFPAWPLRQLGPGVDLQSDSLIFCKAYYQKTISSSILMRTNLLLLLLLLFFFFLETPDFHFYRKDRRKENPSLAVQELMKVLKQLRLKYTEVSLM